MSRCRDDEGNDKLLEEEEEERSMNVMKVM
jgi:hypothetical protein